MQNYYLCSQEVVAAFPELEKSKPFKSGYDYDRDKDYYVVIVDEEKDWPKIELHYASGAAFEGFWIWCIEPSQLKLKEESVDDDFEEDEITLEDCKSLGVFCAIEQYVGVTKENNIAYAFYLLAEKYDTTPIGFANQLSN